MHKLFPTTTDIMVLSYALSCLVGNGRRQKSYLKQHVKINLQSYEPGGGSGRRSEGGHPLRMVPGAPKIFKVIKRLALHAPAVFCFSITSAGLSLADLFYRH
jgi:hypothetical protein